MTRFEDGPAKGQVLLLHRSPRFLRVTEKAGKFDALDQLADTPEPGETLYAYEMIGEPVMCHIRASGGRGGFYPIASYGFVLDQPTDSEMRKFLCWHDWCEARRDTPPRTL